MVDADQPAWGHAGETVGGAPHGEVEQADRLGLGHARILGQGPDGRRRFGVDAPEFSEQDFIVRLIIDVVDVDVLDNPLMIDDENCSFCVSLRP